MKQQAPGFWTGAPPQQRAAVVVPWYQNTLTADEETSLRHLQHYLGAYDCYLAAPASLSVDRPGFRVVRFPDGCFESRQTYSRLLLSRPFYEAFTGYEYVLIYQLDCLVFSDTLDRWCEAGYDYIGSPWFNVKNDPRSGFSRVGNGGFSLRRVEGFLRVIDSERPWQNPLAFWAQGLRMPMPDIKADFSGVQQVTKKLRVLRRAHRQGVDNYLAGYHLNEDRFWSDRARLFDPAFRAAPVETALHFAFECAPRYCFEQIRRHLPFGCHAWATWDRAFWEPYLLPAE